jgi:hypothetical protein
MKLEDFKKKSKNLNFIKNREGGGGRGHFARRPILIPARMSSVTL